MIDPAYPCLHGACPVQGRPTPVFIYIYIYVCTYIPNPCSQPTVSLQRPVGSPPLDASVSDHAAAAVCNRAAAVVSPASASGVGSVDCTQAVGWFNICNQVAAAASNHAAPAGIGSRPAANKPLQPENTVAAEAFDAYPEEWPLETLVYLSRVSQLNRTSSPRSRISPSSREGWCLSGPPRGEFLGCARPDAPL